MHKDTTSKLSYLVYTENCLNTPENIKIKFLILLKKLIPTLTKNPHIRFLKRFAPINTHKLSF